MTAGSHSFHYLGFPRIQTFPSLFPLISNDFQILRTHSSFLQAARRIRKAHAPIAFQIASNCSFGCLLTRTIRCLVLLTSAIPEATIELVQSLSFL